MSAESADEAVGEPETRAGSSAGRAFPQPWPRVLLSRTLREAGLYGRAVEDAPAGVEAAHAAGLVVIGIRSRPDVSLAADEVADSLSDPRVRAWLGLTGAPGDSMLAKASSPIITLSGGSLRSLVAMALDLLPG